MAWRFQKRKRIASGLSLNLGKRGGSLSFGRRGARVTAGRAGLGASVSLVGTGLAYLWRRRRKGLQ